MVRSKLPFHEMPGMESVNDDRVGAGGWLMGEVGFVATWLRRSCQNCLVQVQPVGCRCSHHCGTLIKAPFA